MLETLLLILVAYILIIIQSYIFIRKRSIHELAHDFTKEVNDTKITLSEVILGLLGIIMICVGYFLSTKLVENVDSILQPFVILFLTVLGSYFSLEVRYL